MATSVPVPMAIPTLACAKAGASFIPSPAIATTWPWFWSFLTSCPLFSGRTSAITSSIPSLRATTCAVFLLSPVSMTTRTLLSWSIWTASGVEAFMGSETPIKPASSSLAATNITVWPSSRRLSTWVLTFWSFSDAMPTSPSRNGLVPRATSLLFTPPMTPFPVMERKFFTSNNSSFFSFAPPRIAAAKGCSLFRSKLAPSWRRYFSSHPLSGIRDVKRGFPSVRVPVLSTTKVLTFSIISNASAFFIKTPAVAPRPVPTMMDIGVANPNAQGHAMINTATALTRAKVILGSGPNTDHIMKVSIAINTTAGTK